MSCGCLRKELVGNRFTTHSKSKKRLYRTYHHMKERCYSPKAKGYVDYGGRGISICDEWLSDFESFYDWAVSHGYSDELSIDRIDVNGNYEPSNCRWATNTEQERNKRHTRKLTFQGKTKPLAEWSEIYGLSASTIWGRVQRGWNLEEAFKTPLKVSGEG